MFVVTVYVIAKVWNQLKSVNWRLNKFATSIQLNTTEQRRKKKEEHKQKVYIETIMWNFKVPKIKKWSLMR